MQHSTIMATVQTGLDSQWWYAPIYFDLQAGDVALSCNPSTPDGYRSTVSPYVRTNLCDLATATIGRQKATATFRFNPVDFPKTPAGRASLIHQLVEAGKKSGLSLVTTGGKKTVDKYGIVFDCALVCKCSVLFQGKYRDRDHGSNPRLKASIAGSDDEVNSHPTNELLAAIEVTTTEKVVHNSKKRRATWTSRRASSKDPKCPFRLPIYVDDMGFLLKANSGTFYHGHHGVAPKLVSDILCSSSDHPNSNRPLSTLTQGQARSNHGICSESDDDNNNALGTVLFLAHTVEMNESTMEQSSTRCRDDEDSTSRTVALKAPVLASNGRPGAATALPAALDWQKVWMPLIQEAADMAQSSPTHIQDGYKDLLDFVAKMRARTQTSRA
jgi:hypothetical protein